MTIGGVQSNHTRQVAAVAAKLGMKCRLVQESWVPFQDAVSRWTRTRLQIVAVVAALGALAGVTISWLLSRVVGFTYDFAELENGARNGLMVVGLLAADDLLYVQGPRGAWLRRLSFGRTVLIHAALFTAIIVASLGPSTA